MRLIIAPDVSTTREESSLHGYPSPTEMLEETYKAAPLVGARLHSP